jgi:hypothetical protein
VKQVARELGVRYVLEGSVRKSGNRVRITGQLIDTASGAHIWADRFDSALDDIFELQDQIAGNVVGAIEPKLRQSEIQRATRKPTESLDAWDFYLRALTSRHKYTDESLREAIGWLSMTATRRLAAVLAADVAGYSRLMGSDEEGTRAEDATALGLRGRSRKISRLEHLRPQSLLHARIAHAKEARAIGRVSSHSGFEYPDDLEDP